MCFRTQKSVPESGPPNRPGSQASWKFPSLCWREEVLPVLSLKVCAAFSQHRRSSQSPPGRPLLTLPFPQNRHLHPLPFPSQARLLAQVTACTQGWDQSGHGCTALGLWALLSPGALAHDPPGGNGRVNRREAVVSFQVSLQGSDSGQGQPALPRKVRNV